MGSERQEQQEKLKYRDRSYGKIVLIAIIASALLHSLIVLGLSGLELDLFSLTPDREMAVSVVEPQAPPVRPEPVRPQPA
ncbi:MAG TPA: hypothetical protein VK445_11065, partial [Dissulfurispiraceae bacterium]|nr:hypothetical protein [Dissulfurispiraceae bacterium]